MMRSPRSASLLHVGENLMQEAIGALGTDKPVRPDEIELLFDRQMKQRVIPIVPVRSTQDILVLTNHQLGYYYNEEDHE